MTKRKPKPAPPPALPKSHLIAMREAGFEALGYLNRSIEVQIPGGTTRYEWLPEDLINWDRKRFVRFRRADEGAYRFDGWETHDGHSCGGRYQTVHGALGWFIWLDRQRERANG